MQNIIDYIKMKIEVLEEREIVSHRNRNYAIAIATLAQISVLKELLIEFDK